MYNIFDAGFQCNVVSNPWTFYVFLVRHSALLSNCFVTVSKPTATNNNIHMRKYIYFETYNICHRLLGQRALSQGAVGEVACSDVHLHRLPRALCLFPASASGQNLTLRALSHLDTVHTVLPTTEVHSASCCCSSNIPWKKELMHARNYCFRMKCVLDSNQDRINRLFRCKKTNSSV